jgi:hypothetical protein
MSFILRYHIDYTYEICNMVMYKFKALLFRFSNNTVIIHNTVTRSLSLYIYFCISDIFLMMADMDSRNML